MRILERLRDGGDAVPYALVSEICDADTVMRALNSGADLFLPQGGSQNEDDLMRFVDRTLSRPRAPISLDGEASGLFAVLDELKDAVVMIDGDGNLIYANQAARDLLGLGWEDLDDIDLLDIVSPQTEGRSMEPIRGRIRSNHWDFKEYRFLNADGEEIVVEASALLLRHHGRPVDMLIFRDITESKRASDSVEEEMDKLKSMFEAVDQLVYVVDIDQYEILYLNKAAKERNGKCLEGGRCYRHLQGKDSPCDFCNKDIIMKMNGQPYVWEHYNEVLDRHFHVINRMIPWPDGRMVRFEMAVDISDSKKALMSLSEEKERASRILDSMPDMVFIIDKGFRIVDHRTEDGSGAGIDAQKMIGKGLRDVLDAEAAADAEARITEAFRTGMTQEMDISADVDGNEAHFSARVAKLSDTEAIAAVRDITEVKKTEEVLRESEERYRNLFDNAPAMVVIYDWSTMDVVYANRLAIEAGGYDDLEDMKRTGMLWSDPPYSRDDAFKVLQRLESESAVEVVWPSKRKDGSTFWKMLTLSIVPIGGKKRIVSISQDISERVEVYQAMKDAERRYRTLISASNTGAWEYHREDDRLWSSPEYFSMLGREPPWQEDEGDLRSDWVELIHPEDRQGALSTFLDYLEEQPDEMYENTFRMSHAEGGWVWIWSRGRTLRDEQGRATDVTVGTHIDITEIKEMQFALAESERAFRTLADSGHAIVYTTDSDGALTYLSKRWEEFTGKSAEEGLKAGRLGFVHEEDRPSVREQFSDGIEGRKPFTLSYRHLNRDCGYRWVQDGAVPLYDGEGMYQGHIGQVVDIHELRTMEDSLRTTNAKLNLMTSVTRHDILNQLMVMKGYITLLKEKAGDEELRKYAKSLESSSDLIQKQIEFTNEYQKLGVNSPEWQDVESVIAAQTHRPLKMEKNVSGLEVYADPLFENVFRNLIDNSKRHGGDVSIIRIWHEVGRDGWLRLYYEDDGPGIPRSEKARVFRKGYGSNRGLGLFLVKEILDITDMEITEAGSKGEGVLFRIDAPPGAYRFR